MLGEVVGLISFRVMPLAVFPQALVFQSDFKLAARQFENSSSSMFLVQVRYPDFAGRSTDVANLDCKEGRCGFSC